MARGASGSSRRIDAAVAERHKGATVDDAFEKAFDQLVDVWQTGAGLKSYGEAVADAIDFRAAEGHALPMTREQWLAFASRASHYEARAKAKSLGVVITWDCEHAKTPDGYYAIRGGVDYAIVKSLAAAPYADLLWMETKTADLHEAKVFADAIHAVYPDKMLAYNLSPSFSWDTTGMTEDEMRRFPEELGKLGYVFNFITYGGHQIDGVAAEEFSRGIREDGMLALARLQRKIRLLESPYRTPQTLVGGPRAGRGADEHLGTHLDDQGDGQGVDPVPAPRADRGSAEAARGVARRLGAQARRSPAS